MDLALKDAHLVAEYDQFEFGFYYSEPVASFPSIEVSECELVALFVIGYIPHEMRANEARSDAAEKANDSQIVSVPEFGAITARLWTLLRAQSMQALQPEAV